MNYKSLLTNPDGSRRNLASAAGLDKTLLSLLWRSTFPVNSGFKYKLSSVTTLRGKVVVKTPSGAICKVPLEKALRLGPTYLEIQALGQSRNVKCVHTAALANSPDRIQAFLDNKFGPASVKVLKVNPEITGKLVITIQNAASSKKTVASLQMLRDRNSVEALFAKNPKALVALRNQESAKQRQEVEARKFLTDHELTDFTFVESKGKDLVFRHVPSQTDLPIQLTSFRNETPDKASFLRRAAAWFRFSTRTPVAYSDSEWASVVESRSGGLVDPASHYTPRRFGESKYSCKVCSLVFSYARPKTRKHSVLRCPSCSSKKRRNYSKAGVRWLEDVEHRLNISIQKATDETGEKLILLPTGKTHVDGYSALGNTVFEYHGSRWHGNPLIFYLDETPSPYSTATAKKLILATFRREEAIVNAGYNLIRIWDQDFIIQERYEAWMLANIPRIKKFLSQ